MDKIGEIIKEEVNAKIFGEYDVVVCGGGTAGVVAALASARNGAKTVLIEDSNSLGGMLTTGNAGVTKSVVHGIDDAEQKKINSQLAHDPQNVQVIGGIPLEMLNTLIAKGDAIGNYGTAASYVYPDTNAFKLYLFELLFEADVKIMLRSRIFNVIKENDKITGVLLHTKEGALAVLGKYFIDCTGDGDVAAFSGAPFRLGSAEIDEIVKDGRCPVGTLDPIGAMYRIGGVDFDKIVEFLKKEPERFRAHTFGKMGWEEFLECYEKGEAVEVLCRGGNYTPPCYFQLYNNPHKDVVVGCISVAAGLNGLMVDDVTKAEYGMLKVAYKQLNGIKEEYPGFENAYIIDVPTGIRETRHIDGEYVLTIQDILTGKDFEDTIGLSSHPIDISPKPKCIENVEAPQRAWFKVPYRSLVVKGVDNLLIAGRHISATREASGCTRPTICCMVGGEAAGTAAALLSRSDGIKAKDIDILQLRKQLKDQGVVLEMKNASE